MMNFEDEQKIIAAINYSREFSPRLQYHNFSHELDVWHVSKVLGRREGLDYSDLVMLDVVSLTHDLVYFVGRNDNEENAAQIMKPLLLLFGYSKPQIEVAHDMYMATKVGNEPQTLPEMVLKDADLANLGRADFYEKNEVLRLECGVEDVDDWNDRTLGFMKQHRFYTQAARDLYQAKFEDNIRDLEKLVRKKDYSYFE